MQPFILVQSDRWREDAEAMMFLKCLSPLFSLVVHSMYTDIAICSWLPWCSDSTDGSCSLPSTSLSLSLWLSVCLVVSINGRPLNKYTSQFLWFVWDFTKWIIFTGVAQTGCYTLANPPIFSNEMALHRCETPWINSLEKERLFNLHCLYRWVLLHGNATKHNKMT